MQRLDVNSPWPCPFLPPTLVLRGPSTVAVSLPIPLQQPHGLLVPSFLLPLYLLFFYSANSAADLPLSGVIAQTAHLECRG